MSHRHSSLTSSPLGRRLAASALIVVIGVGLSSARPLQDDSVLSSESLDSTRNTLEQWVETRRIISKERRDWALGRELLQDRIEVAQREIDSLRERITDAEASLAEADGKRLELVESNEKLKGSAAALGEVASELEGRTSSLLGRLPEPIRERVKPLSQQIPQADAEKQTKLSLSQRFQNVVGILNEVNKFNREISAASEVRSLPDGSTAEVTAVYIGVGQGYYVTGNGLSAGIGHSGPTGWTWIAADEISADVARAVSILKNEEAAAFLSLPVELD